MRSPRGLLADRPWRRRLLVTAQQLVGALAIYTAAGLLWRYGLARHGRPGLAVVVIATAVVAVILARLRRPLERLVNWLAFGERADGYELISGFLQRMAGGLAIDEVLSGLAEAAARSVGSERSEVRVWLADGSAQRQAWPIAVAAERPGTTVAVRHAGDDVGEIEVGVDNRVLTATDRRLLDELTGPAGLALSTVRLTYELRDRAVEIEAVNAQLRASRQRILEARATQQRQVQTEVERRVLPHLAAASALLSQAKEDPEGGGRGALGDVRQLAVDALDALRDLARGIFPPRLSEAGLVVALQGWGDRAGVPVDVQTSGDLAALRSVPDIEAAAFFCIVTALSSLRPGGGLPPTTTIAIGEGHVELRVVDRDGRSEVPPETMVQLTDRAEAFAGQTTAGGLSDSSGAPLLVVRLPLAGATS